MNIGATATGKTKQVVAFEIWLTMIAADDAAAQIPGQTVEQAIRESGRVIWLVCHQGLSKIYFKSMIPAPKLKP